VYTDTDEIIDSYRDSGRYSFSQPASRGPPSPRGAHSEGPSPKSHPTADHGFAASDLLLPPRRPADTSPASSRPGSYQGKYSFRDSVAAGPEPDWPDAHRSAWERTPRDHALDLAAHYQQALLPARTPSPSPPAFRIVEYRVSARQRPAESPPWQPRDVREQVETYPAYAASPSATLRSVSPLSAPPPPATAARHPRRPSSGSSGSRSPAYRHAAAARSAADVYGLPAPGRMRPTLRVAAKWVSAPRELRSPAIPVTPYQHLGARAWAGEDGRGEGEGGGWVGAVLARFAAWRARRREAGRERRRGALKSRIVVVGVADQGPDGKASRWI
jgi:hypothetical protein